MSIPAVHWALSQRTGSSSRKAVLKCIAEWMIGEKAVDCYPTVEQIAFETELNRKTVMDATRALEKAGFIKKRRACNKKLQWETHYTLVGYEPSEWIGSRRPECRTFENPNVPKPEGTKNGTRTWIDVEDKESTRTSMRTSGTSSAIAAVASAQAQTLPTSFPQSSNSQNHSETKTAGKDSLPNASERSVAAHRDRPDTSDEQTRQNDAGCSQNASTRISGVCPENEPPPMSDEDLENLFANAQLEECPPFPEKGDHPSEKDAHLSSGDKKPARKKPATTAFCAVPRPDDVDPQVWSDWMAVRKRKNKPLTETAFNFLKSQAEKAGISTARAIELCAQNGWLGFREEYLRNSFSRNSNSYQPAMKTPIKRKRAEDYVWKVK